MSNHLIEKPFNLFNGDCLHILETIPDFSIDLVIADLPYGVTACKWDTIIPFAPLWKSYRRIVKPGGSIVFTAIQPFTSAIVMSNPEWFRHHWIYEKAKATNFVKARRMPMRYHEDVLIFCDRQPKYKPQMIAGKPYKKVQRNMRNGTLEYTRPVGTVSENSGTRFPSSIIRFVNPSNAGQLHATQKPVELIEYLINTYSDQGDVVLDNVMGSGTTGIACINTGRQFIGIEKDPEIFVTARGRISSAILERHGDNQ
jgi:DNA modification methylase